MSTSIRPNSRAAPAMICLDLVVVTHVGAAEEDAASELANFIGCRLTRFLVDVGEADIATLARKAERYLLADAASRPAHQYDLIVKVHDSTSCTRGLPAAWAKTDRSARKMKRIRD